MDVRLDHRFFVGLIHEGEFQILMSPFPIAAAPCSAPELFGLNPIAGRGHWIICRDNAGESVSCNKMREHMKNNLLTDCSL